MNTELNPLKRVPHTQSTVDAIRNFTAGGSPLPLRTTKLDGTDFDLNNLFTQHTKTEGELLAPSVGAGEPGTDDTNANNTGGSSGNFTPAALDVDAGDETEEPFPVPTSENPRNQEQFHEYYALVHLANNFANYDTDGNGHLTADEIRKPGTVKLSPEALNFIIDNLDVLQGVNGHNNNAPGETGDNASNNLTINDLKYLIKEVAAAQTLSDVIDEANNEG